MANRKKTMIADKFLDRRISNPRWVLHLGLHSTTTRSASTNTNLIPCEVLVPGVKKVAGFHFAMAYIVLHICAYTWTFRRIVSSGTVIPIALYKPRPCSLISVQKATILYTGNLYSENRKNELISCKNNSVAYILYISLNYYKTYYLKIPRI